MGPRLEEPKSRRHGSWSHSRKEGNQVKFAFTTARRLVSTIKSDLVVVGEGIKTKWGAFTNGAATDPKNGSRRNGASRRGHEMLEYGNAILKVIDRLMREHFR